VQSVHEGIIYSCELCEYKATRKSNLNKHVQTVHVKGS